MNVDPELGEDESPDVGLGDGAVDVGEDEPRRLVEEENGERHLDLDRVDDEDALVVAGLKSSQN